MTDANLVRVLQAQLHPAKGRRVGLIDYRTVAQSAEAIKQRMHELQANGIAVAIVDALNDEDLGKLGEALRNSPLLTAGSGLGNSLPRNWGFTPRNRADLPPARGLKAILAGSCSVATNTQVQRFIRDGGEAYALQPAKLGQISNCKSPRCFPGPMPAGAANPGFPCWSTRPRSRIG